MDGNSFKLRADRPQLRLQPSRPSPCVNRHEKEEIHLTTNLLEYFYTKGGRAASLNALSCCARTLEQLSKVDHEHTYGDGQEDNTEELTHDIDRAFPQIGIDLLCHLQDEEYPEHIDQNTDDDVYLRIFCTQRQERRERTRACDEREYNRNQRSVLYRAIIFKQFDVQDHLYRHEKQDHSTGNGETANVNTEELEYKVAGVEKSYQQGR